MDNFLYIQHSIGDVLCNIFFAHSSKWLEYSFISDFRNLNYILFYVQNSMLKISYNLISDFRNSYYNFFLCSKFDFHNSFLFIFSVLNYKMSSDYFRGTSLWKNLSEYSFLFSKFEQKQFFFYDLTSICLFSRTVFFLILTSDQSEFVFLCKVQQNPYVNIWTIINRFYSRQ